MTGDMRKMAQENLMCSSRPTFFPPPHPPPAAPLPVTPRLSPETSFFPAKILILRHESERRKKKEKKEKKENPTETGPVPQSHAQDLFVNRVRGNPSIRLKLPRVERMRHTTQVGIHLVVTRRAPDLHAGLFTVEVRAQLADQASCGDAVRRHQVACATRQVMNFVENKNETTGRRGRWRAIRTQSDVC